MGKTLKNEISQFLSFQGFSGSSHTLASLSNTFKYVNLAEDMKKAIPQILGDMSKLNSHDGLKTGLLHIFFVETQKKKKIVSRKFAGISPKFAGISRKFADICFNHFKNNISSMCGHGPRISRTLPLYFFSTEPIPRIHGAQTYQRARLWVPQLGKIIYRIFFVLSQFLFSIAFLRKKMVHRVFFRHLGFAGMPN